MDEAGETERTGCLRRIALCLAASFLVIFCSCGGSSSEDGSSSSSRVVSTARSSSPEDSPEHPSSVSKEPVGDAGGKSDGAKADGNGVSTESEGKHGQQIVPPKGSREPEPTPAQRAEATVADMSLSSPELTPGPESTSVMPGTFTCDGKNSWPTLRWAGVPDGTTELDLFVMNLVPVGEELFFDWAVAGLDPDLGGIEAGELPKGAIVGRNSSGKNGYSLCPVGSPETFIFALYALPGAIPAKRGFDPKSLRQEVLAASGNVGLMAAAYARG